MPDRRRRRRRSGGSDRPEWEPRPEREPRPGRAPREPRADDAGADREPRGAGDPDADGPGTGGDVADALAEYERRRDELIRARRRDRDARTGASRSDAIFGGAVFGEEGDEAPPREHEPKPRAARRGGAANPNPRPGAGTPRPDPTPAPNPQPRSGPGGGRGSGLGQGSGPGGGSVGVAAAGLSRAYSPHTPREIRRDGPVAWAMRGYRRFRRSLRENLTAYGHRYNTVGRNAATEPKPFLLWLVDLPRLIGMWAGHLDYRSTRAATLLYRDLRSRPPRILWNPAETLSPHVAFTVPTTADLNPVWRWPAVREWVREFRTDWRSAFGLLGAAVGAALLGAREEFAAELAAVGDRTGRGLAWTQAQATRFDSLFRTAGRRDDRAWWFACGTGMCGLTLTSLLFLWDEPARAETAAAPFGGAIAPDADGDFGAEADPGLVPDAALAVDSWPDPDGDPDADFDLADPHDPEPVLSGEGSSLDDPWGGDADPSLVARADSDAGPRSDSETYGGLGNPFADWNSGLDELEPAPEAYVRPPETLAAQLRIGLERTELPPGELSYAPPDDDAVIEVAAAPVRTALPRDAGGWDEPRRSDPRGRDQAAPLPPAYVGVEPGEDPLFLDRPGDRIDAGFAPLTASDVPTDGVPAAAGAGLKVTREAPASAGFGSPHTYDLWVENVGDAPAAAVVEEAVGPGVRVTDADPPAAFLPGEDRPAAGGPGGRGEVGGGTLTWDLRDLPPGGVRRLSVTVHPLPRSTGNADQADRDGGPADAAFTTEARVTGRWAVAAATAVSDPAPAEPPPAVDFPADDFPDSFPDLTEPDARDEPPPAEPTESWPPDWPSDRPPVNDFEPVSEAGENPRDDFGEDLFDPSFDAEPLPEEPRIEEPTGEPPAFEEPDLSDEPAPRGWEPERDWEPEPLRDDGVRPAQILTPEPPDEPEPPVEEPPVEEPPVEEPPVEEPVVEEPVVAEPADEEPLADENSGAAPRLRVTLAGPREVRSGEDVRMIVTVANEGRGPAEAVTIACPVPAGLRHPGGRLVRCVLGELAPGEVRTASFIARAVSTGPARPELTVTARGGLIAAVTTPLTVRPTAAVCP